jgi:hypothetical protein
MVAYIASRWPLPLIPWRQDAPAYNVTELTEHKRAVCRHLALPHVRQAEGVALQRRCASEDDVTR